MLVAFRSVNYVAQLLILLHEQVSQCVVPFKPLTPRSDILLSLVQTIYNFNKVFLTKCFGSAI